jgi:acyl-CoA synthetase (AMP-forming)/AMP-acid ligase II
MTSAVLRALVQHARLRPEAAALLAVDARGDAHELSWRALLDATRALARDLQRCEGKVLLVALPNGPEFVVAVLAGLWAGAWVLPAPPDLPPAALDELARGVGARIAIAPGPLLARLPGLEQRVPSEPLCRLPAGAAARPAPSSTGALLLRTSATTGASKIARRAVSALEAVGEGCRQRIGICADDRMLMAVPIFHSYGIEQGLFTAILAGCRVELHASFDASRVREALLQGRVTILPGVPVIVDALARLGPARAPALRRVYSAGSPLPRRVADAFEQSYGVRVGQIYGATEFGAVTFNDPDQADFDPESAGRPLDGAELRIAATPHGEGHPAGRTGGEGEVTVGGPSVLIEYLGDPEPVAPEGLVRSGDLGRIDARGRVFITGRLKLLIDVGGFKVNPAEVQAVLMRHPQVREAIVLPLAYTDTASRLRAVVIPEPGCTPSKDELRAFARNHLMPYQIPRSIEFRTDVPRSPTGKILRSALEAELRA